MPLRNLRLLLVVLAAALAAACASSKQCDGSTCDGCCDPSGTCRVPSAQFCGQQGAACVACIGADVCQLGACISPGGGGAGAGSTSGSGSTSSSSGSSGSTAGSTSGGSSSSGSTTAATASSTSGSTGSTSTGTSTSGGSGGSGCADQLYGLVPPAFSPDGGFDELRAIDGSGASTLVAALPKFDTLNLAHVVDSRGRLLVVTGLDAGATLTTLELTTGAITSNAPLAETPFALYVDSADNLFSLLRNDGGFELEHLDRATGQATPFTSAGGLGALLWGPSGEDTALQTAYLEGSYTDGGYALASVNLASGATTVVPLEGFDDLLWSSGAELYGLRNQFDGGANIRSIDTATGASTVTGSVAVSYVQTLSGAATPDGSFRFIGLDSSFSPYLMQVSPSGATTAPVPLDANYRLLAATCR